MEQWDSGEVRLEAVERRKQPGQESEEAGKVLGRRSDWPDSQYLMRRGEKTWNRRELAGGVNFTPTSTTNQSSFSYLRE